MLCTLPHGRIASDLSGFHTCNPILVFLRSTSLAVALFLLVYAYNMYHTGGSASTPQPMAMEDTGEVGAKDWNPEPCQGPGSLSNGTTPRCQ